MVSGETIKRSVLERIAKGEPIVSKGKAKYLIRGKIVHVRFCSFDPRDSSRFKFNINPNTLTAEYELWICGDESTFYLIPIGIIRDIYEDPDAYIDRHHPEIRVVSLNTYTNQVTYGIGGKSLNIGLYKSTGFFPELPSKKVALSGKYGHVGEGEDHKKLKEWIAANPRFLGLTDVTKTEIEEHVFPSGDVPDIIFHRESHRYAVVEVETVNAISGAYQAIKYKVLLCAELGLPLESQDVRSILVAWSIPPEVKIFCQNYKIECIEKKL